MRKTLFLMFIFLSLVSCTGSRTDSNSFESELPKEAFDVFIRIFKSEGILETWIRLEGKNEFQHFKSYPVCKKSGELGPKRKEGDFQVPEGIYKIDRFNPNSLYHLSLGLNYPNKSDRIRGDKDRPGSDIFIHGKCVTIGCVPITDPSIEEVYQLCQLAKEEGQKSIYVHIFPGIMDSDEFKKVYLSSIWKDFWDELFPIYMAFEIKKDIPYVLIDKDGRYAVRK